MRRVYLLAVVVLSLSSAGGGISWAAEHSILDYLPAIFAGARSSPNPGWINHSDITTWHGTSTCLQCHNTEGQEVFSSVHYQWQGAAPDIAGGPPIQGKLDTGVNSYCINTTGNWEACGTCHIGLGGRPEASMSTEQLNNIDCLVCHQQKYKRKKVNGSFQPDIDNMDITMVEAARTVHLPNRVTCLQCHAKGGGGDNYKRGDMALAHGYTSDRNYDVHMATTGADLMCQSCHFTEGHKMAGRGSDLRPVDLAKPMACTDCHEDKESRSGHQSSDVGTHVARVACQSCHISSYARNADDTISTEETETHRTWLASHVTASGAIHPQATLGGDLVPRYKWWNGQSKAYNLYDQVEVDPSSGNISTSSPVGTVSDAESKLYPFKHKTAIQPLVTGQEQLIALDTKVYFASGNAHDAVVSGLVNMGYSPASAYRWVQTDTFQLITHEVEPSERALACADCHDNTGRIDLQGELGYHLKAAESVVCVQCHEREEVEESGYQWIHEEHVEEKRYDCSWCHTFSRPERGLR